MKKTFIVNSLIIFILLAIPWSKVKSQTTTSSINLKVNCDAFFSTSTSCKVNATLSCYTKALDGTPSSCEFIKSQSSSCLGRSWKAIYGMPSVDNNGYLKMSARGGNYIPLFTPSSQFSNGQAIYTNFNFKKDYKYTVTIFIVTTDGTATFKLAAFSGLTVNNSTAGCGSIAQPPSFPQTVAKEFTKTSPSTFTYELITDEDYTQLALFSSAEGTVLSNISIGKIEITGTPIIAGNSICSSGATGDCNQLVMSLPYSPSSLVQSSTINLQANDGQPLTYSWQINNGTGWSSISGATGSNYTPQTITNVPVSFRRIVSSTTMNYTSYSNIIVIDGPPITGNNICCNQTLYANNGITTGAPINSLSGNSISGNVGSYTFQWQFSIDDGITWTNIQHATNESYTPTGVQRNTKYRRMVKTSIQNQASNIVTLTYEICGRPSNPNVNEICGNQYFYNLHFGDIITPGKFIGSNQTPINNIPYTFKWQVSFDHGSTWNYYVMREPDPIHMDFDPSFSMPGITLLPGEFPRQLMFDKWYGVVEVWYRREYLKNFDAWNCAPFGFCGKNWHSQGFSNIAKVFLSSLPDPDILTISGPSTITCSPAIFTNGFQVTLTGGDAYSMLASAKWEIIDNPDWTVDPGYGIWGANIRPFTNSTTTQNYATIKATLISKEGKLLVKTFQVTAPTLPNVSVNPSGAISICQNQPASLTATALSGLSPYSISFTSPSLNLGATSSNGNSKTITIPVSQTNVDPQILTVTVVDANQCKITTGVTVYPAGHGWIHDKPYTGYYSWSPQLPALGGLDDEDNPIIADDANIIEENRHNIYYVGKDEQGVSNTLLTYQWDNATIQWYNFSFPKGNPATNITGPLAIHEDVNNVRTIYYINSSDNTIYFIKSNGGYINEYTTTGGWSNPTAIIGTSPALGLITPLSDGRVIYKGTDGHLYITVNNNPSILLDYNIKGNNCIITGNTVLYIASDNSLKMRNFNTNSDIPGNYNSIIAHDKSAIAYSSPTSRWYVVGTNGEIIMYNTQNAIIYTYSGPQKANAAGLTINKATGVLYFSGTATTPDAIDTNVYQCYLDGSNLLIHSINIQTIGGNHQYVQGTPGIRKLFTDYNLFFVSNETSKIQMYYYFAGTCGPGLVKMAANPDYIPVNGNNGATSSIKLSIEPNPNAGTFTLTYSLVQDGKVNAVLYNSLGEMVNQSKEVFQNNGDNSLSFSKNDLIDGMYFVRLFVNGETISTEKIVIHK